MVKRLPILLTAAMMLASSGNFAHAKKKSMEKDSGTQIANTISYHTHQNKKSDIFYSLEKGKSHEEIVKMQFSDILNMFPEDGLEMIRKHFVQEINILRAAKGLNALEFNELLTTSAQNHATFLDKNSSMYDFTLKSKATSRHLECDTNGGILSGPGKRATQAGYLFSLISENISAVGALRPNNTGTISSVLAEWMAEEGHKKNIFSLTRDIGVGYYNGIIVMVFAK